MVMLVMIIAQHLSFISSCSRTSHSRDLNLFVQFHYSLVQESVFHTPGRVVCNNFVNALSFWIFDSLKLPEKNLKIERPWIENFQLKKIWMKISQHMFSNTCAALLTNFPKIYSIQCLTKMSEHMFSFSISTLLYIDGIMHKMHKWHY